MLARSPSASTTHRLTCSGTCASPNAVSTRPDDAAPIGSASSGRSTPQSRGTSAYASASPQTANSTRLAIDLLHLRQKRYPKLSASFYRDVVARNAIGV